MVNQPHKPARQEQSTHEIGEAIDAIAEHSATAVVLREITLGDAKNDGSAERADDCCAEVRKLQRACEQEGKDHFFRPIAM